MAIHVESLNINHFRGIHSLSIENLNHINIIAGDNNSGKTSVLESLVLLRAPENFNNILRLARLRESSSIFSSTSLYESFINLFPKDLSEMQISLDASCKGENVSYNLKGKQKKIMVDAEDALNGLPVFRRNQIKHELNNEMLEADTFTGELKYKISGNTSRIEVKIDEYETASGKEISRKDYLSIVYLSPTEHVRGNIFNRILRNDSYKQICLRILQLIDTNITDLLILKNDNSLRPVEYIKHSKFGNMPLSTYGDGIKKILSLANGIAQAAGGVLLIDEVETAIHSKYYDDIFRFLVKAAIQFDVQLFITTHSIEAIDGLLATQDYNQQTDNDDISVITFKKEIDEKKTYSRVLSGRHVHTNRENFGFEVRV